MAGINSYGFYIPKNRITVEEIAQQWGKNPVDIKKSLQINEKAVAGKDEDSLTMAVESARSALTTATVQPEDIRGVFVGSETHPYVVNPTSTIVAEYCGLSSNYLAFDTQFACKAGTGAMCVAHYMLDGGFGRDTKDGKKAKNGGAVLVVGTDKATGKPGDMLEYTAGSASASFIVTSEDYFLKISATSSFSSDTPDFWRRHGEAYPSHAGRFTAEPGYFSHTAGSLKLLMEKTGITPKDITRVVFHMPNASFPIRAAKSHGFTYEQIEDSLIVQKLGNSYAASAFMGLCAVIEKAQPGETILLVSYGSGAGSDAILFEVQDSITERRKDMQKLVNTKKYLNYFEYQQLHRHI